MWVSCRFWWLVLSLLCWPGYEERQSHSLTPFPWWTGWTALNCWGGWGSRVTALDHETRPQTYEQCTGATAMLCRVKIKLLKMLHEDVAHNGWELSYHLSVARTYRPPENMWFSGKPRAAPWWLRPVSQTVPPVCRRCGDYFWWFVGVSSTRTLVKRLTTS
jgi:hypothetical protein